jgi:[ribosomal protein S5]-alanine N-acetyltransferase
MIFGNIYIETNNLLLRMYTLDDINGLFKIMSDSRIHLYTKDKNNPLDKKRTEEYVVFFIKKHFTTLNCFHGALIEKSTNKIIGLAGLNPFRDNAPEIEFKIGVDYWNKGYATEIGKEIVKKAFEQTRINSIYGFCEKKNVASKKVLEKVGLKYLGEECINGNWEDLYIIEKRNVLD